MFRRNGRHAGEHLIAAARALFNRAIADRLLAADASPAHRVHKPRRLPSPRRALLSHELEEINRVARTTGNDVILDALLLRLGCAGSTDRLRPSAHVEGIGRP